MYVSMVSGSTYSIKFGGGESCRCSQQQAHSSQTGPEGMQNVDDGLVL